MLRRMRTNWIAAALAALLSMPALADGVEVKISFPWLAPPPLVVVEPGIQVVPDYDEEVFFVDGWYWVRRDGRWLHARDWRGGWVYVAAPPPGLARIPHGKYRRWKAAKAVVKQQVKAEKAFIKHEAKHHGGGHGKGHHKGKK